MPTPKGGGMQMPIGDGAAMTVSPLAADDQRKAVRQVVRLARTPAEAREALDALGSRSSRWRSRVRVGRTPDSKPNMPNVA